MSHSNKAALRGEPSYVWRSGQKRRLEMIAQWTKLNQARVLDSGGGNGMYAAQIQQHFDAQVDLCEIEFERVQEAIENAIAHALVSTTEHTPYAAATFDTIISNEVIEHVADDHATLKEMARILKIGGRAAIFCPNRWYPFETHGHYWGSTYHFGNTPLINYLPDFLRDRLAPHVRAYTKRDLLALLTGLPFEVIHYSRVYGGYDNLIPRLGKPMITIRDFLYSLEDTWFDVWGLSHFLVIEKVTE